MKPTVTAFFDEPTFSVSYVVADLERRRCVIVDPVLGFDAASGRTDTNSVDGLIEVVKTKELTVEWILETHVHADHISAAPYVKNKLGGQTAIGANVTLVQKTFAEIFNISREFDADGSQFDVLFHDNELFRVGDIPSRVLFTPGHTPACITYLIGDAAFVGDTLFMPDYGTARADFPGGDAARLYQSIQKLFSLPGSTRLFMCHDYGAPGRDQFAWETTVEEQRTRNIHIREGVSESAFVKMRTERDQTLSMPRLLAPAVQVNIRAGALPPPEDNGISYLKLPVNRF